jgi:hypothetical protein
MFYNVDSGLYLTFYRAYDPVPGRWLSRDPIGELGDPTRGAAIRAGFYSPAWGRFISEDPIGFAGRINLYGYVNQSPTRFTDPTGLLTGLALACPETGPTPVRWPFGSDDPNDNVCTQAVQICVDEARKVPPDAPPDKFIDPLECHIAELACNAWFKNPPPPGATGFTKFPDGTVVVFPDPLAGRAPYIFRRR